MKATFENTNAGDRITLDGTLCEVDRKGEIWISVGPVSCYTDIISPEEFDAANYQHLSGREV